MHKSKCIFNLQFLKKISFNLNILKSNCFPCYKNVLLD